MKISSVRAFLDDLAALHDVDALGHLAHDAEVVRDEQHRHAHLALQLPQQLEDLRLDGDVERRRRLVGDQQVGLVGERHGDHDALALAARELVREGVEALLGLADADLVQQLEHARRAALARPCAGAASSTSPTCLSMVCSGLSDVIGSWKIMEMRSPRIACSCGGLSFRRSRPSNQISPEGCEAAG